MRRERRGGRKLVSVCRSASKWGREEPGLELASGCLWSGGAVCTFPGGGDLPRMDANCGSLWLGAGRGGGDHRAEEMLLDSLLPHPGFVLSFPRASRAREHSADPLLLLCWHLSIQPKCPTGLGAGGVCGWEGGGAGTI